MLKFLTKRLKEGETYRISKFDVEENTPPKYQKGRVNHGARLVMCYGAEVTQCRPDLSILTNGINLVAYRDINDSDPQFYVGEMFYLAIS